MQRCDGDKHSVFEADKSAVVRLSPMGRCIAMLHPPHLLVMSFGRWDSNHKLFSVWNFRCSENGAGRSRNGEAVYFKGIHRTHRQCWFTTNVFLREQGMPIYS